MSVKIDATGRRSVEIEVEVPGTPEQVWEAIATGPGVTAWFVKTVVDGRVGGEVRSEFAPGHEAVATVTEWDPPHRFAADSPHLSSPDSPAVATEWIVEARSGDTCVVRVVHSLFASTDDWDDQLEGFETGWPAFFKVLRIYLRDFPGQPSAAIDVVGMTNGEIADIWRRIAEPLGLVGAVAGERRTARDGDAPALSGVVETAGTSTHPYQVSLRLDQPAPGAAFLGAVEYGGGVFAKASLHFYGEGADAAAAAAQPRWQAWFAERVPSAAASPCEPE